MDLKIIILNVVLSFMYTVSKKYFSETSEPEYDSKLVGIPWRFILSSFILYFITSKFKWKFFQKGTTSPIDFPNEAAESVLIKSRIRGSFKSNSNKDIKDSFYERKTRSGRTYNRFSSK